MNTTQKPIPIATGYLSITEAAELLGKSNATVYRLIKDRKLAAVYVGRTLAIRRSDLDRYLRKLSA